MSIIRVKLQKDFTIIYTPVLEDSRLSFKAKGLWAYCMSRPDDWEFHVNHLATVSQDGVDAVYSGLKELEKVGLVSRTQKNEKGKFGTVDYIIYPYPQELKKSLPQTVFPQTEDPHTGNPALPSIDSYQELKGHESCAREAPLFQPNMTHDEAFQEMQEGKKKCPEMKDMGSLADRVAFLKQIKWPGGQPITQRNLETWARMYSLWRLKKCAARVLRMVESGKELTNPEGLFYKLLSSPEMESTQIVEEAREQAQMWMDLNNIYFRMSDDYISFDGTGKDVPLALGASKVIEVMKGWADVR